MKMCECVYRQVFPDSSIRRKPLCRVVLSYHWEYLFEGHQVQGPGICHRDYWHRRPGKSSVTTICFSSCFIFFCEWVQAHEWPLTLSICWCRPGCRTNTAFSTLAILLGFMDTCSSTRLPLNSRLRWSRLSETKFLRTLCVILTRTIAEQENIHPQRIYNSLIGRTSLILAYQPLNGDCIFGRGVYFPVPRPYLNIARSGD